MDYEKLAELLFPDVTETPEDMEKKYPRRNLPEDAKVTRFAPSPTGYIHLGGVYGATIDERLGHQSGGVTYLRIEDTDAKREVADAAQKLITTLAHYGIKFDEGACLNDDGTIGYTGAYGPYRQSERAVIYHVYAKQLVKEGKAYPVFTTEDELEEIVTADKKAEVKSKVWTDEANEEQKAKKLEEREFTLEEVEEHLKNGDKFVLRILSDGDGVRTVKASDLVRGPLEFPENDEDFVLLKSDGIPTYHFAHAVDDHLMGTTHVVRGEEWLPSLPKHVQLFRYLGFKLPKYIHTAQIMRLDENGCKKKLSKRDMGANMDDYTKLGYTAGAVREYLLTVLNSNFEDWRRMNPDLPSDDFPFSIKKMSNSGCLIDFEKLDDISKNILCRYTAEQIYDGVLAWAKEFDPEFALLLESDEAKAKAIFAIGRGGKKPRKDFGKWNEIKPFVSFFYDSLFKPEDKIEGFAKDDIIAVLEGFAANFDINDEQNVWFEKIKESSAKVGFCPDVKEYKQNPDSYKGSVADASSFIRVAVTGRLNSPDLYAVMRILGKDTVLRRIKEFEKTL